MARLRPHFAATLITGLFAPSLIAQNNALDFDGIDDQVIVPGASALIANATAMTLACWVYPTNTAPAFPDFDGIAGFRNELDCDFYMVQISPANTIEGRLRASNGLFYTVTSDDLELNTWQHVALVYDGSTLKIYHNGALSGSIAASGTITSPAVDMHIGNVPFQIYEFLLTGRVDELVLFDRALPADEVQCLAFGEVHDGSDLVLHYTFDQGTAGGTNTGITTLTDAQGAIDGILTNFALSGATSNFVNGFVEGSVQNLTICQGESILIDGIPVSTSGTYTGNITSPLGCATPATVNLSVIPVNIAVTQLNVNLIATATSASFQWLDCNNGFAQVPGATGSTFTPTASGSYAVEVTQSGCTDTSSCYTVIGIGIAEESAWQDVSFLLDPSSEEIILSGAQQLTDAGIALLDAQGRILRSERIVGNLTRWSVAGLPQGVYLLRIHAAQGDRTFRVCLSR